MFFFSCCSSIKQALTHHICVLWLLPLQDSCNVKSLILACTDFTAFTDHTYFFLGSPVNAWLSIEGCSTFLCVKVHMALVCEKSDILQVKQKTFMNFSDCLQNAYVLFNVQSF